MKKALNRFLAVLLALTLLVGCAACAEPAEATDETPESHTVTGTTYPYLRRTPLHARRWVKERRKPLCSAVRQCGDLP